MYPVSEEKDNQPSLRRSAADKGTVGTSDAQPNRDRGKSNQISIPQITLPKGGGALKGIDEKFQVNGSNGTASFSIQLPFSKTRSDFAPALSLSYNSGSGNSSFGLGWSLEFPAIQRRTDKKLPQYNDAEASDVFMFTGVEDLVPVLTKDENNNWVPQNYAGNSGESITRYRPRIEGSFNRIERITPANSSGFFWKVTTPQNVVTIFGKSESARIANPQYPDHIFKWLPEFSYDDRGNCMEYEYVKENFVGVSPNLCEQNRLNNNSACTNTYLKSILYGNTVPYVPPDNTYDPIAPGDNAKYVFETVFDYGDHDEDAPSPEVQQDWLCRYEPFSDYKAGFEIRTYRLCRRILFFHDFKELDALPCLVRSLDLSYKLFQNNSATDAQIRNAETDYIIAVQQSGYIKNGTTYFKKSLPPVEFSFQELNWNTNVINITQENLENDPVGLSQGYQWTDLWSEGISGILTEQANGWFYKSNSGDGNFTPAVPVIPKPSLSGLSNGQIQLQDLEADGRKFVVSLQGAVKGYFELSDYNEWQPFESFDQLPNVNLNDPNTKYIDLNGDGKPDIIISEDNIFTWYENLGIAGYDSAETAPKPYDEEAGPAMVFADSTQSIFLADISGDGMTDIVRIRNGEICYWPNLGYGKFGTKVNMDNAPVFDSQDMFNPSYLHLFDVSGTGATDILYLGKNECNAWFNLSGNGWSEMHTIDPFPSVELPNQITVVDFLGNGTGCIVWSSPLPEYADAPMRYIDLMQGIKPYIMTGYKNNFGKEISWNYQSSTQFYLQDKADLKPWLTKLPFPVQCVSKAIIQDLPAETTFTNSYSYHHGYYDHAEREFRGFGCVEQIDTEDFENFVLLGGTNVTEADLHQPPVRTVTWYHTGFYFNEATILDLFEKEYTKGPHEFDLPNDIIQADPEVLSNLSAIDYREIARACKGMVLRQEVYANDNSNLQNLPYSVATHNCLIKVLQLRAQNKYGVFFNHESEAVNYHYERNLDDPRIEHSLNLEVDDTGHVLQSASVVYGRKNADTTAPDDIKNDLNTEQQKSHVIYTQNNFTNGFDDANTYRLALPSETKTYELTGFALKDPVTNEDSDHYETGNLLDALAKSAVLQYDDIADNINPQNRLIEDVQTFYLDDNLQDQLVLGTIKSRAFPSQHYTLAFTPALVNARFNKDTLRVTDQMLTDAQYFKSANGNWWNPSGKFIYVDTSISETVDDAKNRFYIPIAAEDAFKNQTQLIYDAYFLHLIQTIDAIKNTSSATIDYRMLQPKELTDINNNVSEVLTDELGMVIVTSVYGDENDGLRGDKPLSGYTVKSPVDLNDVISNPLTYLQQATTFFYYDLNAWKDRQEPVCFAGIVRETHESELSGGQLTKVFKSVGYTSGLGQNLQTKVQAEPGEALQWNEVTNSIETIDTTPNVRWVGTGRTILNNKGNPVKQYEPYFSATYEYETEKQLVEIGFSSIITYDPVSRAIRVDHPNGTFTSTEFDAWMQKSFDENDNVKNSGWYDKRIVHPDPAVATPEEIDAANKAAQHDNTPSIAYLDSLGRTIFTIADNGSNNKYHTQIIFDIEGNQRSVIDHRDNAVMQYSYNMASDQTNQVSMDAGQKITFSDVMGKPVCGWDAMNNRFRTEYDAIHRPVNQWLILGFDTMSDADKNQPINLNRPQIQSEILIGFTVYGEGKPSIAPNDDQTHNLRGKPYQSYDQSGLIQFDDYDFKGNAKNSFKQLCNDYKSAAVNWFNSINNLLEQGKFNGASRFDATDKIIEMDLPDGSKIFPVYNEANLLNSINIFINGKTGNAVPFVDNIDYNAKAQRVSILYSNNTSTKYFYDKTTYRLTELTTTRKLTDANTGNPVIETLQDLNYTYDPVGNITSIIDKAEQKSFFNNSEIDPGNDYVYDALYRLTSATGRELISNTAVDQFDNERRYKSQNQPFTLPGDGSSNAMRNYTQQYNYDEVGNMLNMSHNSGTGVLINQWTRTFEYNNDDAARALNNVTGTKNNQVLNEWVGNTRPPGATPKYLFDANGNMLNLQQGSFNLTWNYVNQLKQVDLGGGGIAYYIYDAGGQRTRKVIETNGLIKDRKYLGSYEIYTEKQGSNLKLERETLHVMDDKSRIALIETRTEGDDNGADFLIRYQYGNHLGTSFLELTGTTNTDNNFSPMTISYEEYYPFGSTAYQEMDNANETPKRYRYTGKERDEESGLYYFGTRYYACWIVRWISTDQTGIKDGLNIYEFTKNNPSLKDTDGTQTCDPNVSTCIEENQTKRPSWEGGATYGYSPAPPSTPKEYPPAQVTSSAKTPAPPTPLQKGIENMQKEEEYNAAHPAVKQGGTLTQEEEINGLAYRDAYMANRYPSVAAIQKQQAFINAASVMVSMIDPEMITVEGAETTVVAEGVEILAEEAGEAVGSTGKLQIPKPSSNSATVESIEIAQGAPKPYEAPNTFQIEPQQPGQTDMAYGTQAHQELPRGVSETNPSAQGRFNVAPGLTGEDFVPSSGYNATYGEMKAITGRQSPMIKQGRNWGFEPQTGRYYFYDRESGIAIEGIIQTEKFPSGRFR
jgi:RHS repeat-associated protein